MKTHRATRQWLTYSHRDLRCAETLIGSHDDVGSVICNLSQQAVEKAMKAVFVFLDIQFLYTHDLVKLKNLLPKEWSSVWQDADLDILSSWAIDVKYPNDFIDPSIGQAKESYQQAKAVVIGIEQELVKRGLSL